MPSDSMYWRWPSLCSVSNAIVDLPDPDRPVKTTNWSLGSEKETFLRLWSRGPRRVISDIGGGLRFADTMFRRAGQQSRRLRASFKTGGERAGPTVYAGTSALPPFADQLRNPTACCLQSYPRPSVGA